MWTKQMKKAPVFAAVLFSTLAYAQEDKLVARKVESDYAETKVVVDGIYCDEGKSSLLENPPEIVAVLFEGGMGDCRISLIHKKTFKLAGKAFHVLTYENKRKAMVGKFVFEKSNGNKG